MLFIYKYSIIVNCKETNNCSMLINVNLFLIILLLLMSALLCYDYMIHRCQLEQGGRNKVEIKYRTLLIFQSASDRRSQSYSNGETNIIMESDTQYNDTICRWTRSKDTDIQEFVLQFLD